MATSHAFATWSSICKQQHDSVNAMRWAQQANLLNLAIDNYFFIDHWYAEASQIATEFLALQMTARANLFECAKLGYAVITTFEAASEATRERNHRTTRDALWADDVSSRLYCNG